MQTERGTKYCSRKISKFRLTKRLFKWTDSNNLYLALSGKSASVHHIDFLLLRPKYYAILYRFIRLLVTKHPLVGESYMWTLNMFYNSHKLDVRAGNVYSALIMQYIWKIYLPAAERSILNKTGSLMEWRML